MFIASFTTVSTVSYTTYAPRGYETIVHVVVSSTVFGSTIVGYKTSIGVDLATLDLSIATCAYGLDTI